MRSTVPVSRASISSLSEPSIVFNGTNPRVHSRSRPRRSAATERRYAILVSSSVGSKMASTFCPVEHVGLVALDRVGDEVRGERHHPGPRVLGSALVEADRVAIDRLEERRQEQADRPGTDDVDATFGTRGQAHREPG